MTAQPTTRRQAIGAIIVFIEWVLSRLKRLQKLIYNGAVIVMLAQKNIIFFSDYRYQ
jgi:hypothetical protein